MTLQYVSHKLQSITKTQSLWKQFVWPCFYVGDDTRMCNVLKQYGEHVRQLSFPHQITAFPNFGKVLEYCSNTVELTLPTIKPDPEQLGKILPYMLYVCKHWTSSGIPTSNSYLILLVRM